MVEFAKSVTSPQPVPPPATQLSSSEQNARATRASADPGGLNSTQTVAQVGEATRAPTGPQAVPSAEELTAAVAELRNSVARINRSLEFAIDKASERSVIKVIDSDTKEVVRQIPSEEVLALAAQLKELTESGADPAALAGTLFDARG
jgi:flagellar protein FlaG